MHKWDKSPKIDVRWHHASLGWTALLILKPHPPYSSSSKKKKKKSLYPAP